MGCVCCSVSSFISILLDALERISLCTVCALLTCCLLITVMIVLIIGIGLGFHYCTVQTSVEAIESAAKNSQKAVLRSGGAPDRGGMLRTIVKGNKRGLKNRVRRGDIEDAPLSNNNTMNDLNPLTYNYTVKNGTETLFNDKHTLFNIVNNTLYDITNFTITTA